MFRFIKRVFTSVIMLFSSLSSANSLKCISINNQECKVRPEIASINSNEPIFFYPYSIRTGKDVVVVVIVLMIPMGNYAFPMLLKI